MKLSFILVAVIIMCGCNQPQGSQTTASEQNTLTIAGVEQQVERFRAALLSPQTYVLEDMTSESLTYGHSSGLMEDRDKFIHSLVSGKFKFTQLEFIDQTVHIEGSTAVVRHTLFGDTADEGKDPGTVTLKVLTVWQKADGKLRLLARQAVRM